MTRLDEREIPGASDKIGDAPDLVELRVSKRGRVVKREWPEEEAPKSRKRQRTRPPTPISTQQTTTTQASTNSFYIYNEIAEASTESSNEPTVETSAETDNKRRKRNAEQPAWLVKYTQLRNSSKETARDYLIEIIGHDDFPQVLKVPEVKPKVLIKETFDPGDPLAIWRQFITEDDCAYIALQTNANARASIQQAYTQRPIGTRRKARRWKKMTTAEMSGYIGALFILGTQGASSLVDNWTCSEDSPLYPLRNYISCNRFQQIGRYLKINQPGEVNNSLNDKEFWRKVDPLVSSFRQRCRANLQPGNVFSIDEQLRRNRGRWKHALQISSKAESKGVKIYSLCAGYYCFDFLFASKVVAVPEAGKFEPRDPDTKPFTMSERVVLTLVERLQVEHPDETLHLTLACDNFFTTHKLFKELRARGISAYGTAKDGSGMPKQHIQLRDCTDKQTDYGLVCNSVFGGVNHVTFVDQKAVHMMTTAHDVVREDPHWREAKTRRDASLQRARETAGRTELPYPQLSHDYNQGMNSCDVASQVWSYYSVSRYAHWRNWWPMLWIILDASIANVLYLYRLKGYAEADLSHRDLQTRIGLQLLRDPASVLRQRDSQVMTIGLRPSKITRPQHQWIKAGKTSQGNNRRGECEQCRAPREAAGKPVKDRPVARTPLQEISTNTHRTRGPFTSFKCKECDVWLCHTSECWQRQHLDPTHWDTANV